MAFIKNLWNKIFTGKIKRLTKKEELALLKKCLVHHNFEPFVIQYARLIRFYITKTFDKKNFDYTDQQLEDLFQDIMVKFFDGNLKQYNPAKELSLSGWVILITIRTTLNYINSENLRGSLVPIVQNDPNHDLYLFIKDSNCKMTEVEILTSLYSTAKDLLPPREKEVFFLHWLENMTTEQIAGYLGISVEAVNAALSRAKSRLKRVNHLFTDAIKKE